MSSAAILDLARLRRSCGQCSLRQLCLPGGIGVDDLDRLDRIVRRRRSIAGKEPLFASGSVSKAVFVVREGSFRTVVYPEDGQRQVIGFHLPGELIGLDALGEGCHRCDAEALEQAAVCEVPLEDLERIAAQVPALQHHLMGLMGRSMGRDQDHIEMLGRHQAVQRVLLFLHGLMERYRVLGHPEGVLLLSMSRDDIASFLGLVIETVSRSFTRLQDDGLIAVRGRQVQVLDIARFAAQAHEAVTIGQQIRRQ